MIEVARDDTRAGGVMLVQHAYLHGHAIRRQQIRRNVSIGLVVYWPKSEMEEVEVRWGLVAIHGKVIGVGCVTRKSLAA